MTTGKASCTATLEPLEIIILVAAKTKYIYTLIFIFAKFVIENKNKQLRKYLIKLKVCSGVREYLS